MLREARAGRAQAEVIRGAREQAAAIIVAVERALDRAGTGLDDLAAIVVGDGPGSFTGLRIGWAAAKGLAQEREIPLWGVPSLAGLAWVAWHAGGVPETAPVAACYDALRGQVFAALYQLEDDRLTTLLAPRLVTVAEFARVAPARPYAAIGDGAQRYEREIRAWTGRAPLAAELDPVTGAPGVTVAEGLVSLARGGAAGRRISDPGSAEPIYGRPADAQARWEARHGRSLSDSPSRER